MGEFSAFLMNVIHSMHLQFMPLTATLVKILELLLKLFFPAGAIYDRAMKQGLVSESAGKTPEATMAAALYTDIKKYRDRSTFVKPREGLFGLRDWNRDDCDILVSHNLHIAEAQANLNSSISHLLLPKSKASSESLFLA